jgi:transcription initiation factor TFIIIB Brf1 subunit/transcription initiation factor TFIIB
VARGIDGHAIHGSANTTSVSVDIDTALLERLESLPDKQTGRGGHAWTEQEDAILRRYWPIKRQSDVAKVLGMSQDTCRKRYRELVDENSL